MGTPVYGNSNKVTVGQKFLSLVGLDERISKLEAGLKKLEAGFIGFLEAKDSSIDALIKEQDEQLQAFKTLTDKHNQHLKFGHPNNKPQVVKENKKND